VMQLKRGLEEQWGAYNDMRVRLDAAGQLAARSQPAPAPRTAQGTASRAMRAAAHAATAFRPAATDGDASGTGDLGRPAPPGEGNISV
jgi:hypothetical protein